jgi:DNA polymerase V
MEMYHDAIPKNAGISVHTGFPNPATDASLKDLDLNQLLVSHSAATYYMEITGNNWQQVGIFDGDIAIIDRAITAHGNDIVVWWHQDSFTMTPLHKVPKDAVVWGTITATIHRFKEVNK